MWYEQEMTEDDQASKTKVNCNWVGTTKVKKNEFELSWHPLEGLENIWKCTNPF